MKIITKLFLMIPFYSINVTNNSYNGTILEWPPFLQYVNEVEKS